MKIPTAKKIIVSIIMLLVFIITSVSVGNSNIFALSDTEEAVFKSIKIDKTEVQQGESIGVSIEASGHVERIHLDIGLVNEAETELEHLTDKEQRIEFAYPLEKIDEKYYDTIETDESLEPGKYKISAIYLYNDTCEVPSTIIYNSQIQNTDETSEKQFSDLSLANFTILPDFTADITAPVLESISLDKSEVNQGDNITVTLKASDDISGIAEINCIYQKPSKDSNLSFTLSNLEENNGQYIASMVIENGEAGLWEMDNIELTDKAGNSICFYNSHFYSYEDEISEMNLLDLSNANFFMKFSDLSSNHIFSPVILDLASRGLIKGKADGTFGVDENLTRAQVAVMLIRALGIETEARESAFIDVAEDYWAKSEIVAAAEAGILEGYGDGRYGPDDNLTRAQLSKMMANAFNISINSDYKVNFFDVSTSYWAKDSINALVSNGVVQGFGKGFFGPDKIATRGQFALYLSNSLKLKAGTLAKPVQAAPITVKRYIDVNKKIYQHPLGKLITTTKSPIYITGTIEHDWIRFTYKDQVAYIKEASTQTKAPTFSGYAIKGHYIRETPGGKILDTLKKGTFVNGTLKGNWLKITHQQKTGYVPMSLLENDIVDGAWRYKELKVKNGYLYVYNNSGKLIKTRYVGHNHVLVSLNHQYLWVFNNNKLVTSTPIVSGKSYYSPTVVGNFHVSYKTSAVYLSGIFYVDYWVPFYGDYGIHDAYWQKPSHFYMDSKTYQTSAGSSGCVNVPPANMRAVYNNLRAGTPVTVVR